MYEWGGSPGGGHPAGHDCFCDAFGVGFDTGTAEVSLVGDDVLLRFVSGSSGWRAPVKLYRARRVAIGGGGGGGSGAGGGGGAGDVRDAVLSVSPGGWEDVIVGEGGAGGTGNRGGEYGGTTVIGDVESKGGNWGAGWHIRAEWDPDKVKGASGGGASFNQGTSGAAGSGCAMANKGGGKFFAMGDGGAGGGGAGGAGHNNGNDRPGAGGDGVQLDITGELEWYGAGGAGGGKEGFLAHTPHGLGGPGGWKGSLPGGDGKHGTGSGGSGGGHTGEGPDGWDRPAGDGGRGGRGVAFVRFSLAFAGGLARLRSALLPRNVGGPPGARRWGEHHEKVLLLILREQHAGLDWWDPANRRLSHWDGTQIRRVAVG